MKHIILIIIASSFACAGDYWLTVCDDPKSITKGFSGSRLTKKVLTVSKSLKQYFSDQKPDIGYIGAAFANGHIDFCGKQEIESVYQALLRLKKEGWVKNKRDLKDFTKMIKSLKRAEDQKEKNLKNKQKRGIFSGH